MKESGLGQSCVSQGSALLDFQIYKAKANKF